MVVHATVAIALALVVGTGGAGGPGTAREQIAEERSPRFQGKSSPLDPATRKRVKGSSWHPGCPVGLGDLRLLRLTYLGFDGEAHNGRLIVHKAVAEAR